MGAELQQPVGALEKPVVGQEKGSWRWHKPALITAGTLLLLVCAAAAVSAVLCTTALRCTLSPFSMAPRASGAQQGQQGSGSGATDKQGGICLVQYSATLQTKRAPPSVNVTPPLLLGGAATACTSGCQPRDSIWSESCKLDPNSRTTWGICEQQQRPALIELADRLSNGSALHFSPCDLHALLQGRTLWLIGDSHMKSTYTAVRCILMDFWVHTQGECAVASDPAQQLELHQAELYAPRKLTLTEVTEPRCIHLIGGGRVCFLHTVRGEVLVSGNGQNPGVLEVVQKRGLAGPDDVFYASFGRWYTHACQHFDGSAFNKSLEALAANYEATKQKWPHVFFGVPPFDHTTCDPAFDYKRESTCPKAGNGTSIDMYKKIADYSWDVLEKHGLPIIDYQEDTMPLNTAHLSSTRSFKSALDCLHYCRPGLPELDIWFVYHTMQQRNIAPVASAKAQTDLPCTPLKPFF